MQSNSINKALLDAFLRHKKDIALCLLCSPLHYFVAVVCTLYAQTSLWQGDFLTALVVLFFGCTVGILCDGVASAINKHTIEKMGHRMLGACDGLGITKEADIGAIDSWPVSLLYALLALTKGIALASIVVFIIGHNISLFCTISMLLLAIAATLIIGGSSRAASRCTRLARVSKILLSRLPEARDKETKEGFSTSALLHDVRVAMYQTCAVLGLVTATAYVHLVAFGCLSVFWDVVSMLKAGHSPKEVFGVELATLLCLWSVSNVVIVVRECARTKAAIDRNNQIKLPTQLNSPVLSTNPTVPSKVRGNVKLEGVSYANDRIIFSDLTLDAKPNQIVAIVVTDQKSRSLLLDLLTLKKMPTSGRITIDGTDSIYIKGEIISKIASNITLYNGNLKRNIALENNISSAALAEIISAASLDNMANNFKHTITPCSETALKRISFARALASNRPIAIFDEPISFDGAENEIASRAALSSYMSTRTSIIITNNPTLIRDVDRIYIIHNGRIVEEGNHISLISNGGFYANLYMQYFGGMRNLH